MEPSIAGPARPRNAAAVAAWLAYALATQGEIAISLRPVSPAQKDVFAMTGGLVPLASLVHPRLLRDRVFAAMVGIVLSRLA